MARQVADVVERAGGLGGEPQLDSPMGRNQDTDEPGLIEFGRAVPTYLHVGALQEQQGDEGMQVLIVVTDDQRDWFALLHGQGFRGERPLAGYDLERGGRRFRRHGERAQETDSQRETDEDAGRLHLAFAKMRIGAPAKSNCSRR